VPDDHITEEENLTVAYKSLFLGDDRGKRVWHDLKDTFGFGMSAFRPALPEQSPTTSEETIFASGQHFVLEYIQRRLSVKIEETKQKET